MRFLEGRWGDGSKEVFEGLMERPTGERPWEVCRGEVVE